MLLPDFFARLRFEGPPGLDLGLKLSVPVVVIDYCYHKGVRLSVQNIEMIPFPNLTNDNDKAFFFGIVLLEGPSG